MSGTSPPTLPTLTATSLLYWEQPLLVSFMNGAVVLPLSSPILLIDFTLCPQTASIFNSVLIMMIFLTHSSLLSVVSYTALSILTTVASIKIYAFVMIKMGKVEQDFDPLANVRLISLLLLNLIPTFLDI